MSGAAGERSWPTAPPEDPVAPRQFDLLKVPWLGRFLRWRHARATLQWPLFAVAMVMVLHGLFGPELAPKNLSTLLAWVHYRGVLMVALMAAGNLFCLGCPFVLVRDLGRRLIRPTRNWPRRLRNKWLAVGLLVGVFFVYEAFDLWGSPFWTSVLILTYFVAALVIDGIFKNATFCKFVCPIGQFSFAASTLSPLEVQVRDRGVCETCRTKDCIRGRQDPGNPLRVIQRGCELALFQPRKAGNMDCTFCLDCVHACPHDNVGITSRVPGSELWIDPLRSGIGRFSQRRDLSALAVVFVFGALLNAFGMVSPVYAVQAYLAQVLRLTSEAAVLGVLFVLLLVLEPVLLLGLAAWVTRRWAGKKAPGKQEGLVALAARYAFGLVPLGCGVWLAHYGFHLLTGLWTFVPVAQHAMVQMGLPWLGEPRWGMGGLPAARVYPLEIGILILGFLGTLLVTYRIAESDRPRRTHTAFVPWAILATLLFASAIWLLSQPMEMRGTFLGG